MALSLGLGIGLTRAKGGGFDLRGYLSSLSDGFLFDYTDPDWLFQDPTGVPAVAAANDVIGLALSRRLVGQGGPLSAYLAGQPELVANGEFASDLSGWSTAASTAPSTIVWSSGRAVAQTNGSASARLRQGFPTTPGRLYMLTVEGTMPFSIGSSEGATDLFAGFNPATRSTLFFVAASATTWIGAVTAVNGQFLERISVKEVSRAAATQATSGARPRWQGTAGARFDALDDNHLTTVNTPVGPYFIAANVFVPASLPGGQVIAGQRATANERLFLAVESAGGRAGGGVGQQSFGTINGGPDLRGRTVTIGIAANGSQVRLYADGALVYQDAQVGTWAATTPLRIGALNDAGTAGIFFSGDVRRICGGTDYPDLARFNQISATLGA